MTEIILPILFEPDDVSGFGFWVTQLGPIDRFSAVYWASDFEIWSVVKAIGDCAPPAKPNAAKDSSSSSLVAFGSFASKSSQMTFD